jgi:hypothetical protein
MDSTGRQEVTGSNPVFSTLIIKTDMGLRGLAPSYEN